MAEPWTGLVLAGGQSSRMGRDKAMLPWRGRPLVEHMQRLLRDAGARRVVVSGAYPQYGSLRDHEPQLGPIGGLHSVASELPDGRVLVVPVDMPRLTPSLLQRLLAAPPAACVVFEGQRLPMLLRVDAMCREVLAQLVAATGQQRSLRMLQRTLGCYAVPLLPREADLLANCNTPLEWEALSA